MARSAILPGNVKNNWNRCRKLRLSVQFGTTKSDALQGCQGIPEDNQGTVDEDLGGGVDGGAHVEEETVPRTVRNLDSILRLPVANCLNHMCSLACPWAPYVPLLKR